MRRAWQALARLIASVVAWRFFKPSVFILCSIPLIVLSHELWTVYTGRDPEALGVDPTKTLLHETGETALLILFLTLSVTPIRRLTGVQRVQTIRRMLGVWSFVYAAAHLTVYLVFDQLCYSASTCQWNAVWQDILKRPFIFVGQTAFLCLLLLALTSTTGWQRRLKKNWGRLHRLAYVAAAAGVVHFIWIQKSDIRAPLKWAVALAVLLGIRVYFWAKSAQKRRHSPLRAAN